MWNWVLKAVHESTSSMLKKLIIISINNGLWTAVFALLDLILVLKLPLSAPPLNDWYFRSMLSTRQQHCTSYLIIWCVHSTPIRYWQIWMPGTTWHPAWPPRCLYQANPSCHILRSLKITRKFQVSHVKSMHSLFSVYLQCIGNLAVGFTIHTEIEMKQI